VGRLVGTEMLLSYREAADKIGCSTRKIYRLVEEGRLTVRRLARKSTPDSSMVTIQSVDRHIRFRGKSVEQLQEQIEEMERTIVSLRSKLKPDETQLLLQQNHPDLFT